MQLAKFLPRLNRDIFEVHVAAYRSNAAGFPKEMIAKSGLPVVLLGSDSWSRRRYFAEAISYMKKESFDVVHAWLSSGNHYGLIPAILTGVPVVLGGMRGRMGMEPPWPLVYSLLNIRYDGWIVNSRMLKEFLEEKLFFMRNTPVRTIRNGLEIDDDEPRFRRQEKTCYDSLRGKRPVVGIVGRFHPVKNHLLFIKMAHYLIRNHVDADFWIIGEGNMRQAIEDAIADYGLQDRVKLLGLRRDVDTALARMDVAVVTSNSESCPNALLEAMRAGLPVVSTNCTTLEDIIEEGQNGFVVAVGDAEGLAKKVSAILQNPQLARNMGKRSRQIIEERFSMATALRELEQAYLYFTDRAARRRPSLRRKLERIAGINPAVEMSFS